MKKLLNFGKSRSYGFEDPMEEVKRNSTHKLINRLLIDSVDYLHMLRSS